MRHSLPGLHPPKRLDSSQTPDGFTLIESLVAVIIVSLTVVSVLPPIFWATATRVQNRRAEQAVQLAQNEIERIRTLVERGTYKLEDLPPADGLRTDIRAAGAVGAPATDSGVKRSSTNSSCGPDNAKQPLQVTQYIAVDTDPNNGCKPEFMIQVFRSAGILPANAATSVTPTAPLAFTMGVRVYAAPALETLKRGGTLQTMSARLRGSSGLGQQATNPMAVMYSTVVQSRSGVSLGTYKKLCDQNKEKAC
jgi:prepilin-type N-terminal cleavage/methylation domain-containing protein